MKDEQPRLDTRIPETGFSDADELLGAFLDWASERGLDLYSHQEEAVLEIFSGSHVVLDTPTGSGKSLVATALHFKTFAETGRTVYTAPIKALVSEKFFDLCRTFGAENVGMMTGDGAVNRDAPILCCTAEILANMALREGEDAWVDSVVMDEFHYYADRDRGMAWQIPLLLLPRATFLLMSATLGDMERIRDDLEERTGRPVAQVTSVDRPVPLVFEYSDTPVHETLTRLVEQDRAPIYLVHTSQRAASEQAQALMSVNYTPKEVKREIALAVRDFRFSSPFGRFVQRYIQHGIGVHHAGLLPRYRLLVEKLAQQGLLKVICGTDTLGVGINVPIRTVVFTQLCKFDGREVNHYKVRDFKQISGRAGRAGFDDVGYVVAQAPEHVIENKRIEARNLGSGKKKKGSKKPAPARGYKHWDENIFRQLIERPPERLRSRFSIDHGRLLTMMQYADEVEDDATLGYEGLLDLVDRSHVSRARKDKLRAQAAALLADLEAVGVVEREGDRLFLQEGLQRDFSLYHSLSLFLLHAIGELDREDTDYALDVVTMTEAILEDPRPVLLQQAHKARGEVIGRLKADGVPYEERMEALEDVTWPQPRGEWIYSLFNEYAESHPWVRGENIRPKSVVRDMFERYAAFSDYVSDLGIQRFEGLLLRYLTEVYKALVQNVPAEERGDDLVEVIAFLRAMLGRVDSSLVTEWESMLAGRDAVEAEVTAERPVDISEDRRLFSARVRAELHALVRALSREDWEEAAACVRDGWEAADINKLAQPFLDEHERFTFDHRSRLAHNTVIRQVAPHQWEVRQVLETEDEESAWSLDGRIDLRSDTNPEGPLVELVDLSG